MFTVWIFLHWAPGEGSASEDEGRLPGWKCQHGWTLTEVKTDGEGEEGKLRVALGTQEEEEKEVKPGAA